MGKAIDSMDEHTPQFLLDEITGLSKTRECIICSAVRWLLEDEANKQFPYMPTPRPHRLARRIEILYNKRKYGSIRFKSRTPGQIKYIQKLNADLQYWSRVERMHD